MYHSESGLTDDNNIIIIMTLHEPEFIEALTKALQETVGSQHRIVFFSFTFKSWTGSMITLTLKQNQDPLWDVSSDRLKAKVRRRKCFGETGKKWDKWFAQQPLAVQILRRLYRTMAEYDFTFRQQLLGYIIITQDVIFSTKNKLVWNYGS